MAVLAGEGVTLAVSTDGGTVYNTVAQVVSIDGPEKAFAEVETTHLGSTAKSYRASGVQESGTVTFQVYFDPDDSTHTTLEGAAGQEYDYRLTLTDDTPTSYTFKGIVTSFAYGGMEVESNVTADVTIRLTGDITKT